MAKLQRLTAKEAESLLSASWVRIAAFKRESSDLQEIRIVVPFHSGKILHPKIVKQVQEAIAKAAQQ